MNIMHYKIIVRQLIIIIESDIIVRQIAINCH